MKRLIKKDDILPTKKFLSLPAKQKCYGPNDGRTDGQVGHALFLESWLTTNNLPCPP